MKTSNSVEEITSFKENYSVEKVLGCGKFGRVFLVVDKNNGENLAMKTIKHSDSLLYQNEISVGKMLSRFPHDNIVKIKKYYNTGDNYHILMEYVEGINCYKFLNKEKLERDKARDIIRQLVNAVEHIHTLGYLNTDLSIDNLIVTKDNIIKIIDLGMVQKMDLSNKLMGKKYNLAPEIINANYDNSLLDTKSELWALGIICFILLTGSHPFSAVTDAVFLAKITNSKIDYSKYNLKKKEKKFLKSLLKRNPEKRKIFRKYLE